MSQSGRQSEGARHADSIGKPLTAPEFTLHGETHLAGCDDSYLKVMVSDQYSSTAAEKLKSTLEHALCRLQMNCSIWF